MLFGIDYISYNTFCYRKGDAVHKKLLDALPFLSAILQLAGGCACRRTCCYAPNTIDAYARGVNDWLAFCHSVALTAAVAGRDTVALYVRSLHTGRQWPLPLSATG